jgi:hypothetical protein
MLRRSRLPVGAITSRGRMKARTRCIKLAAAFAVAVLSAGILAAGATPAYAQTPDESPIYSGWNTAYWLYAHAHGSEIQINNGTGPGKPQEWTAINSMRWTSPHNGIVSVSELEVGSTGECVNLGSDLVFYLDSCAKSDDNELFWEESAGSNYPGDSWFINVAASDMFGEDYYMTVSGTNPVNGDYVGAYPAGYGYAALWQVV